MHFGCYGSNFKKKARLTFPWNRQLSVLTSRGTYKSLDFNNFKLIYYPYKCCRSVLVSVTGTI